MDLPVGYALRAAAEADFDAATGVLNADEIEEAGEVVLGADFLRTQWNRAGFDVETDAWVIVDGTGTTVAYGQAVLEEPAVVASWGAVHPAHRARGLGARLLDTIEERAAQLLAGVTDPTFRHSINAGDRAAAGMLSARGLRPVRHFWHMGIDLEGPIEPASGPEGIEVGRDRSRWSGPPHRCTRSLPRRSPTTGATTRSRSTSGPTTIGRARTIDPRLWLLAKDSGLPSARCARTSRASTAGSMRSGSLGSHRGRGIAATLIRWSFASLAGRGVSSVVLNVDAENPTGATTLYERSGMRVIRRWDLWERSALTGVAGLGGVTPG